MKEGHVALPETTTAPVNLGSKFPTKVVVKVGEELKEWPVAYFRKRVLRTGRFVHPKTREEFRLSPEDLEALARTVNEMVEAGIEIPTPIDHVESQIPEVKKNPYFVSSKDNLGFVVQASREGDELYLVQAAVGEDAALTAVRNRSSVWIKSFKDCTGRDWGTAIVHSAYTPTPVMHGLGPPTSLAASRESEFEGFEFSREKENGMKLSEAQKKRLIALAIAAGRKKEDAEKLTDDELQQIGIEWIDKNVPESGNVLEAEPVKSKLAEYKTALDQKTTELNQVQSRETELKQQLAREKPEAPSERELGLSKRLAISDIDGAVAAKKFSPAAGEKIKAIVEAEPINIALDREGNKPPLYKTLMDIAEAAATTPTPGKGADDKGKKLSREEPPKEGDDEKDEEEDRKEMAKKAAAAISKKYQRKETANA